MKHRNGPRPLVGAALSGLVLLCLLLTSLISTTALADDSPYYRKGWVLDFGFKSGFIKQDYDLDNKLRVKLPAYVYDDLQVGSKEWLSALDSGTISDNPLLHGAMFGRFIFSAAKDGVSFSTEILAEHRGASYGVYSTGNTILVPRFFTAIDTTLGGSTSGFRFGISAGNFEDFKLGEGLTIYNIDVQGGTVYLGYDKVRATYTQIADLSAGIGLGIGDLYDLSLSVRDIDLPLSLTLKASAGYFACYIDKSVDDELPDRGYSVSASIEHESSFRLYSQLGIRDAGGVVDQDTGSLANVTGAACDLRWKGFTARLCGEMRYYGRYYNRGYKSGASNFMYRSQSGATIGDHLYPLTTFTRPFSQWAVYTQYQGRDVLSYILRCDSRYRVSKGLTATMNLDLNFLEVSNEESFVYPFYEAGFEWEPADGFQLALTHTNRGMNLDMHYPTLYLLKDGTFMITLNADLDF